VGAAADTQNTWSPCLVQEIVALLPCPAVPLLASLDAGGTALVWHCTPGGELQVVGPLVAAHPRAAAVSAASALAWAPAGFEAPSSGSAGGDSSLLVAARAGQLLFFWLARREAQLWGPQRAQQGAHLPRAPPQWELTLAGAADLPSSMPTVQVLHVLPCPGDGDGDAAASQGAQGPLLLVAAICRGFEGTSLHVGRFAAQRQAGGAMCVEPASTGPQEPPPPPPLLLHCMHRFPSAVTTSLVVERGHAGSGGGGSGWLVVGMANSTLQVGLLFAGLCSSRWPFHLCSPCWLFPCAPPVGCFASAPPVGCLPGAWACGTAFFCRVTSTLHT
jgi:hypothetical protein